MCDTCGCGHGEVRIEGHTHGPEGHHHHDHEHGHHDHDHDHDHHHHHDHDHSREIELHLDIMAKNNAFAARNRAWLAARGVLALNLVSSPGSGKTTLLVQTIRALGDLPASVIEGDQQTSNDAARIRETGAPAIQINTGKGCHLDAHMVGHAIEHLTPLPASVLFIENVGNLVCPAGFDLGEAGKVLVFSVTEGEDKPLKYPDMFAAADLVLINKADLLPHLDFDLDAALANARKVNPDVRIITLSARTGAGMDDWLAWIRAALTRTGQPTAAE